MDSNYGMNGTVVSNIVPSTSGMTVKFVILCSMYKILKQWVSEESIGPIISSITPDTDINSNSDMAFIFSIDCGVYGRLTEHGFGQCATQLSNYDRNVFRMDRLTNCFLFFFMTKMGAMKECSNISLEYDNNTNTENTMTLLSKERIFYSFMTDSLGLNDVCSHVTDVQKGILATNACKKLFSELESHNAANICRPTSEKDTQSNGTGISQYGCVWKRLWRELRARFFCKDNSCDAYDFVMQGIIGGLVSVIGIVCNIVSLVVFHHSVIKTPTTYQLRWLARVDTVFLVLSFVFAICFP